MKSQSSRDALRDSTSAFHPIERQVTGEPSDRLGSIAAVRETSAPGCGFNRSMQHLDSHRRAEDVAYEVPDEDPVHRERQSLDVGALATGRVAARDSSAIRS